MVRDEKDDITLTWYAGWRRTTGVDPGRIKTGTEEGLEFMSRVRERALERLARLDLQVRGPATQYGLLVLPWRAEARPTHDDPGEVRPLLGRSGIEGGLRSIVLEAEPEVLLAGYEAVLIQEWCCE